MRLTRRALVGGLGGLPLVAAAGADPFAVLEARSGGRLGVAVLDTGSGRRLAWRSGERFPMCSTFKLLAAAFVLARVDRGIEHLDRPVAVTADAFEPGHSPLTKPRLGGTMPLRELCAAAMIESDNTAANLLLGSFGGPAGLTGFVRGLGDPVTRLDRTEPTLNEGRPGDPRDTTTPAAMLDTVRRLLLAPALTASSRAVLVDWLVRNRTGDTRLRAGLPAGWVIGDKTGASGDAGTTNDVAIVRPPGREPILIAAYLTRSLLDDAGRNAIIAAAGRIAAAV